MKLSKKQETKKEIIKGFISAGLGVFLMNLVVYITYIVTGLDLVHGKLLLFCAGIYFAYANIIYYRINNNENIEKYLNSVCVKKKNGK